MQPRVPILLAYLILAIGAGSSLSAQTNTAEIAGIVRDSVGGVLPGVAITARHPDTGFSVERVTDAKAVSSCRRCGLAPGRSGRSWLASLPRSERIVVEIGRTFSLDLTLGLAGLTEQVRVSGQTPLLQVTTAEISDVIDNREVVQVPLNGRNFLALAQLSDAVVIPPGGTRGEALQQAVRCRTSAGSAPGTTSICSTDVKVTDELFNNLVINPSVDSIEEFKIQKSMYAPEFGGKASALINVATGSARTPSGDRCSSSCANDAFDSPNYFRPAGEPVPPLRQNQFGGTLGGRSCATGRSFSRSFERLRMERSLTRAFAVPSSGRTRRQLRGLRADLRPADDSDGRRLHAVRGQSHSGRPHRSDCEGTAAHVPRPTSAAASRT
jgi:hypothetical protein